MSLPRVLSLRPDNTLGVQPAPELAALRGAHTERSGISVTPNVVQALGDLRGDCVELVVEWAPSDADELGVKVRCAPDNSEETLIIYDRVVQQLRVDRTHASLRDDATREPSGGSFALGKDEPLRLHIFLDHSVIEVFANDRASLCARVYPTRADSLGIDAYVRGGNATLTSLDLWQIGSIWTSQPG